MSNRKTRERQLAKLAARRAAARRRKRQRRMIVTTIVVLIALVGVGFGLVTLLKAGTGKPAASASPTPSATPTVACGGTVPPAASVKKQTYEKEPKLTIDRSKTYVATMVTSCGTIKLQLDPKEAPNTVNSLVFLIRQRFFDGLLFHRTVDNFVIQGGDPLTAAGDPSAFGTGGPGYKTVDPPPKGVKYRKGDLAMAKSEPEPPGTAGSQFFVVTGDPAPLDQAGSYALVGKVISGLDVAEMIEKLPRQGGATDGRPAQDVYIVSVTVKVT
jgi:peptidyl-prolyl cis-trans isomerase B (cyclophilin B)